jgi:hypothetical protein
MLFWVDVGSLVPLLLQSFQIFLGWGKVRHAVHLLKSDFEIA